MIKFTIDNRTHSLAEIKTERLNLIKQVKLRFFTTLFTIFSLFSLLATCSFYIIPAGISQTITVAVAATASIAVIGSLIMATRFGAIDAFVVAACVAIIIIIAQAVAGANAPVVAAMSAAVVATAVTIGIFGYIVVNHLEKQTRKLKDQISALRSVENSHCLELIPLAEKHHEIRSYLKGVSNLEPARLPVQGEYDMLVEFGKNYDAMKSAGQKEVAARIACERICTGEI